MDHVLDNRSRNLFCQSRKEGKASYARSGDKNVLRVYRLLILKNTPGSAFVVDVYCDKYENKFVGSIDRCSFLPLDNNITFTIQSVNNWKLLLGKARLKFKNFNLILNLKILNLHFNIDY